MNTNKHTIMQAVLQFCNKYITEENYIHCYHILFGYAKLLSMDEAALRVMFSDEKSILDLEEARKFFDQCHLDARLLKTGLPYFMPRVHDLDSGESECHEFINKILQGKSKISSYHILYQILPENDPVFEVFTEGKTIEDVLKFLNTLEPQKVPASTVKEEKKEEDTAEKHEEPKCQEYSFSELSEIYRKLRMDLLDVVKGQNEPVQEFVQGCFQGEVLRDTGKRKLPRATFLFVGPPGVGKTLLAQTAAESLGYPSMLFNMSEYSADQSHEGLIGISPFYKNAEEGRLVKFVRENPKCILIFDEIEKAHRNTIQLFLQILDLGTLDNVFLKTKTEFKDAVIVFTSNACSSIYENQFENISRTPKNVILDALKRETNPITGKLVFPNAICSRVAAGNLIMFNHLRIRDMTGMVSHNFDKTAEQIKKDYGYNVSYDARLPLLFLFHQGGGLDARIATRQSDKFIKNELFELSRQLESHQTLMDDVDTLRFELDLKDPDIEQDILTLFENSQPTEIVVVCEKKDRSYFALPSDYQVYFAESVEELSQYLKKDITLALIDLKCGLKEDGIRGVSLDDYDSVGLKAFQYLEEGNEFPVYLFETGEYLVETDKYTFLQKGAAGIVSSVGVTAVSVGRQIQQIAEELFMEKQGKEFGRRGYILNFNTAQMVEGNVLKIQYHALKKQQALDSESAASIISDVERPKVCFDDVIGAENAKKDLQFFVKYLCNPREYLQDGGKPAKGVLLYGPPGTGKTMLARAMAGESNVAFIETSATNFLNRWVGQSEQNVRDLFRRAKKYAPAIIFIDEIDAIGKTRTGQDPNTESVLNTLLTEMDGFKTDVKRPVFVLAATNYAVQGDRNNRMTLDPALVRRFDNKICVDLPNEKERMQYLQMEIAKKGFVDMDEDTVKNLATRTPGLSLAILQNVLDLAFRNAREQNRLPDGDDLQNALEEYNYGEEHEWGQEIYQSVAIHESGHAYMAYLSGEKPSYMTIVSRGDFGGYMAHENGENKLTFTREELIWRIRCSLAGRAAEEVFYGKEASLNTGASGDLQAATGNALRMICEYGMMDGQLIAIPFQTISSTPMAASYLEQANQLLQREMAVTIRLITEGKMKIRKLADQLVERNHLTGKEILEILE